MSRAQRVDYARIASELRFRFGHKSFCRFGIRSCLATSHTQIIKTPDTSGLEPCCTPTSSSKKVRNLTTGPCDHCADNSSKLIVLNYFSLPFTLFEPYGAVFIMNSKLHLKKKIYLKRIFQNHFALFPCLFTLGL